MLEKKYSLLNWYVHVFSPNPMWYCPIWSCDFRYNFRFSLMTVCYHPYAIHGLDYSCHNSCDLIEKYLNHLEERVQEIVTSLPIWTKIMKHGWIHGVTAPYLMGMLQNFYTPLQTSILAASNGTSPMSIGQRFQEIWLHKLTQTTKHG